MAEVNSIKGAVQAAIQRASQATGVDFGFLMGTARRESGGNPRAQASTSSAAGLFQFTEQTWLATLKQHGAKYGYARYAALISQGSDGRFRVANADARRAVMDLRLDPHAASMMAGELTAGNASYLRGRVGRDPTSGELYAAHFLGPQGSARLIQAMNTNPGANAAALFPDAARANGSIFYRGGRAVSVRELYANLTATGGGAPVPNLPAAQAEFIQYAQGRRADRLRQEQALIDLVLSGPKTSSENTGGLGLRPSTSASDSIFNTAMLRAAAYDRRSGRD